MPPPALLPRRCRRLAAAAGGLLGAWWLLVAGASPVEAALDGPCTAAATIAGREYDFSFDTRDNPVRIPEDPSGLEIPYRASIAGSNQNYEGRIGVVIGPFVVPLERWGPEPNPDDVSAKESVFVLGGALDNVSGIFEVEAWHAVDGTVVCRGDAVVKIDGSPLANPVGAIAVTGSVIFGLLTLAAMVRKPDGSRGRPILGAVSGFLFGAALAVALQQFAVRPLDTISVVGLPWAGAVVGIVLGVIAPVGPRPPRPLQQ